VESRLVSVGLLSYVLRSLLARRLVSEVVVCGCLCIGVVELVGVPFDRDRIRVTGSSRIHDNKDIASSVGWHCR
jgi:hypothetical protein